MLKRLLIFIIIGTALFARMDWNPIHYRWWHYGEWPAWAGDNFQAWAWVRASLGRYVCPPCAALAENYYFVLMEVEAGQAEQADVLQAPYSGNPLWPDGPRFWWGQGEGAPWRPVSMLSWYLYWVPDTVIWWVLWGDLFAGRRPWWMRLIRDKMRLLKRPSQGRIHRDAVVEHPGK